MGKEKSHKDKFDADEYVREVYSSAIKKLTEVTYGTETTVDVNHYCDLPGTVFGNIMMKISSYMLMMN